MTFDAARCWAAPLALVALLGCPTTNSGSSGGGSTGGSAKEPTAEDKAEFARKANDEAFARLQPLAQRAFELAEPVAKPGAAPSTFNIPPIGARRRAELRNAVDVAFRESEGIRGALLPPAGEALLRATGFGLNRARDTERRRPWQTDPTWTTTRALRAVAAIDRAASAGACEACDDALVATLEETRLALRSLAAASTFTVEGSSADVATLREVVERITVSDAAAQTSRELLGDAAQHLEAVAAALGEAPAATYEQPGATAKNPSSVRRLPPALGSKALRRVLEVEENISEDPKALHRALGPIIGQLRKLAETPSDGAAVRAAVDAQRCERLHAKLVAAASSKTALPPIAKDCAAVLDDLPSPASDGEVLLALVDRTMIDPYRTERQSSEGELLGWLRGDFAPASGRHTYRIAIVTSLGDQALVAAAAREAWDASCLAAAALWTHAELGEDTELETQLSSRCGQRPPSAWVREALEHPRRALGGVAIGWLLRGPAAVVPLQRMWWLPLGLIEPLSNPAQLRAEPVAIDVNVEAVGQPPHAPSSPPAAAPTNPRPTDESKAH